MRFFPIKNSHNKYPFFLNANNPNDSFFNLKAYVGPGFFFSCSLLKPNRRHARMCMRVEIHVYIPDKKKKTTDFSLIYVFLGLDQLSFAGPGLLCDESVHVLPHNHKNFRRVPLLPWSPSLAQRILWSSHPCKDPSLTDHILIYCFDSRKKRKKIYV